MKIINAPAAYCFLGNPVVLEVETDITDPIEFSISALNHSQTLTEYPYRQGDTYHIRFEIQDVLLSFFQHDYDIESGGELISKVNNLTLAYSVSVNEETIVSGMALKGGISHKLIKLLAQNGWNFFSFKLMNRFSQFLLTTRTLEKTIVLRETELSDFIFLHPGIAIKFMNNDRFSIQTKALAEDTPCSMNVKAVYDRFLSQHGSLSSSIEVHVGNDLAFSFKIVPGAPSENNYLIRFRNSLGVFELIEVTGVPYQAPEFAEENTYQTLSDYNLFEKHRNRVSHKEVIEVSTGYKTRKEHTFALDMIASSEAYFIYPDGHESRCLITANNLKFEERITSPASINLKVEMVQDESFITPDFDIQDIIGGSIFNDTFSEIFS